jgi:hypothetical protein
MVEKALDASLAPRSSFGNATSFDSIVRLNQLIHLEHQDLA